MGDSGYRGISSSHADARFAGKEKKAISLLQSQGKFPACFAQKVDLRRVNLEVIRPWVQDRTSELLGFEDDVVAEYAMGMLENTEEKVSVCVCVRRMWVCALMSACSCGGRPGAYACHATMSKRNAADVTIDRPPSPSLAPDGRYRIQRSCSSP